MDDRQETVERLGDGDRAAKAGDSVPWYQRELKMTARRAACILIPVGALGMWWNWHLAHSRGEYYPKIAFLAPFIIVLGAFYLMYPDENPTELPKPLRLRHWVMFGLGTAAGAAVWYAFAQSLL